jgi:hypothetical protein
MAQTHYLLLCEHPLFLPLEKVVLKRISKLMSSN